MVRVFCCHSRVETNGSSAHSRAVMARLLTVSTSLTRFHLRARTHATPHAKVMLVTMMTSAPNHFLRPSSPTRAAQNADWELQSKIDGLRRGGIEANMVRRKKKWGSLLDGRYVQVSSKSVTLS